jgi:methionine aminopeptidase
MTVLDKPPRRNDPCWCGSGRKYKKCYMCFRNNDGTARITPGMIFTVEPMINQGVWRHKLLDDHWTAVTADGKRSAQFEHTVIVTDAGSEILTLGTGDT